MDLRTKIKFTSPRQVVLLKVDDIGRAMYLPITFACPSWRPSSAYHSDWIDISWI